jgi:hypothetical protein
MLPDIPSRVPQFALTSRYQHHIVSILGETIRQLFANPARRSSNKYSFAHLVTHLYYYF